MMFSSSVWAYLTWRPAIVKEEAEGEGKASGGTTAIPFSPLQLGELRDVFTAYSGAVKGGIFCCVCGCFFLPSFRKLLVFR